MERKIIALLALVLCIAGAFGVAIATASPAAQRFTLSEADSSIGTGHKPILLRVSASGPISGNGTGVLRTIPAGGNVDHVTVRLAKGSVYLVATDTRAVVHPDLRACKAKLVGRGTFTITGGTGAFRGASGKGTYNRTGTLIGARSASGACLGHKAMPKASYATVTMTGTATVG
jgi:hypothetical protein